MSEKELQKRPDLLRSVRQAGDGPAQKGLQNPAEDQRDGTEQQPIDQGPDDPGHYSEDDAVIVRGRGGARASIYRYRDDASQDRKDAAGKIENWNKRAEACDQATDQYRSPLSFKSHGPPGWLITASGNSLRLFYAELLGSLGVSPFDSYQGIVVRGLVNSLEAFFGLVGRLAFEHDRLGKSDDRLFH